MLLLFIIFFIPATLSTELPGTLELRKNETAFEITLENIIEHVYPNDSTLDILTETVNKVVHKMEGLINEIYLDGTIYLDNLEKEKAGDMLHSFKIPTCSAGNELKSFRKSFTTELGILELPVRATLAELRDKLSEMKRSFEMEKTILELKLTTCFLTEDANVCVNKTSPVSHCFNDSCSPPQQIYSIQSPKSQRTSQSPRPTSSQTSKLMSTECPDGRFKCKNGQCIQFSYACDGSGDCSDGSDEVSGCTRQCLGKRCRNLNCISKEQICNGVDDCGDGTDEENCPLYTRDNCSISLMSYLCANRQECIHLRAVCDGIQDCSDGSDEGANCTRSMSECAHCSGAGGSCLRTPTSPLCLRKCPPDFALDLSSGICTAPPPGSDVSILYETNSFAGTMEKLKLLFYRFSTGLTLLKKHMNYALTKTINKLNKCSQDSDGSLNNPFLIM